MASTDEIDDSLYSRQRYVLGDNAMQRMAKSNILLCGIGGLGVEIAKNIILAGVKSVTVQDDTAVTEKDLGTQFFLRQEDVNSHKSRAEACCVRLAELNPYVSVNTLPGSLDDNSDLQYLKQFQCVVVTEMPLSTQLVVNKFCRSQSPPIQFITSDVYGVFGWCFCDFGPSFEVADPKGEEPKEFFVSKISQANPGVVTTLENRMHGLESGDIVTFREVQGMEQLNGQQCAINVLSPYTFSICDTSGYSEYTTGGVAVQVKVPKTLTFSSLEDQLKSPSLLMSDLSKFGAPSNIQLGMQALHSFKQQHQRLPNVWDKQDGDELVTLAKTLNSSMVTPAELDEGLIRNLGYTCKGCLAPLCAYLGGVVAQEALKAVSGKFTPLDQWLCIDACEILPDPTAPINSREDRYTDLNICLGSEMCDKLAALRLFMVGCGAIGCEMLKNYALLGVAANSTGCITITDNDLIEKSNLNRQFLFRPRHIQRPKSTTGAQAAIEINPDLHIEAQQHKVCPQTEHTVYTDDFFRLQNIVVNALDNVEARRYMDSRCVTNQRALLESGTMGAKGHVQVIVPHVTESYGSQRDPVDEDVPYCTLKSFPNVIEHCIQWARDKFESCYTQKPSLYNKFWQTWTTTHQVLEQLNNDNNIDGAVQVSKLCLNRPHTWADCVAWARLKFEKYFNHKAKQLIHSFPLDTKLQDGSLFWQSPKRPPIPIVFDTNNDLHINYIRSCSRLIAEVTGVQWNQQNLSTEELVATLSTIHVPEFRPSSKTIVTDESVKKAEVTSSDEGDEVKQAADRISKTVQLRSEQFLLSKMCALNFEKDDDSNAHIDYITATANLRASVYNIDTADRLKVKRIAGRIVPAIATTTAAVAGLVAIELIKVLKGVTLEEYKNCFLNLALPVFLFSEPGKVEKSTIGSTEYTLWDRWEVKGSPEFTLKEFIKHFKKSRGLEVSMVVQGVKMVYVPIMPGHKKRLPQTMVKLLKPSPEKPYTDLVVSYASASGEDEMGPPVRYYYQ